MVDRLSEEGVAPAVVDATGDLELDDADVPLSVVDPRQMRDFTKLVGRSTETASTRRCSRGSRVSPRP